MTTDEWELPFAFGEPVTLEIDFEGVGEPELEIELELPGRRRKPRPGSNSAICEEPQSVEEDAGVTVRSVDSVPTHSVRRYSVFSPLPVNATTTSSSSPTRSSSRNARRAAGPTAQVGST